MSREIEFRVRCSATKEVLGYEHFNACLNAGYYYTDSSKPIDDGDGGIDYICQTEFSEQPMLKSKFFGQLIREQFTGKRDCNDVKIFENDIVKMWYAPRYTANCLVNFNDGCFELDVKNAKPKTCLLKDVENNGNTLTVIGNIHQNSELLK